MEIDLTKAPTRTADFIQAVVKTELERFADARVKDFVSSFLVSPRCEMRLWDYSTTPLEFPTWVVAESSQFDYGIVYCERGFGPEMPWGLVFSSKMSIGPDFSWYQSLEAAFLDSRLVEERPNWRNEA